MADTHTVPGKFSVPEDECPPFFTAYLRYLARVLNRSSLTTESVYHGLREFFQYIHYKTRFQVKPSEPDDYKGMEYANMTLSELTVLTREDIEEYLCFLDTVVQNNSSTIHKKITQLEKFFEYLIGQQEELGIQIWQNPAKGLADPVTANDKVPRPMSPADIRTLLGNIEGENAVRDRAIFLLILSTGLKLSQVAALNKDDFSGSSIRIPGKKPRHAVLNDTCIKALRTYLQEYRDPIADTLSDNAFFVTYQRRKRMTTRCIQVSLDKHLARAGLQDKGYSANSLRYTAIHAMLDACPDHDPSHVMQYMGLESRFSTQRFTAARQSDIALRARTLDIGRTYEGSADDVE